MFGPGWAENLVIWRDESKFSIEFVLVFTNPDGALHLLRMGEDFLLPVFDTPIIDGVPLAVSA